MTKPKGWRIGFVAFVLFAAAAIGAPAQTFTTLVSFDDSNGALPDRALVQGTDGNFYGTTEDGAGTKGEGTVFAVTSAGTLMTLHSFIGKPGNDPTGLVLAGDGKFYGTTYYGGPKNDGTVFKITTGGKIKIKPLLSFDGTDGAYPSGPLVQGTDGNFYGTAVNGGVTDWGTVFKITSAGTLTTLHSFCSQTNCSDGELPFGPLVQGTEGNFYGTTDFGGANGDGTIFKITSNGALTTLYSFCSHTNCTDGNHAFGLVQAAGGNFYGTTEYGGSHSNYACSENGCGTVFKITPSGKLTTLYSFCSQTNCTDGLAPSAGLVQATDGNFYGTTALGGANSVCPNSNGCGTVFKITPAGELTTLHVFDGTDGQYPVAGLLQATDGNFYGTTNEGGADSVGTVFSLSMGFGPFVRFVRSSGKVGWKVEILGQGFTGTTGVSFDGTAANFLVHSDTYLTATVPQGATTGFVTVTTPGGRLQSNVVFRVTP